MESPCDTHCHASRSEAHASTLSHGMDAPDPALCHTRTATSSHQQPQSAQSPTSTHKHTQTTANKGSTHICSPSHVFWMTSMHSSRYATSDFQFLPCALLGQESLSC